MAVTAPGSNSATFPPPFAANWTGLESSPEDRSTRMQKRVSRVSFATLAARFLDLHPYLQEDEAFRKKMLLFTILDFSHLRKSAVDA